MARGVALPSVRDMAGAMRLRRLVLGVQKEFEVKMLSTSAIMLASLERAEGASTHHRKMVEAIFPMTGSLERAMETHKDYLNTLEDVTYSVEVAREDYFDGRIQESLFASFDQE
jgi:phosphoenolpyruvate carboxylase